MVPNNASGPSHSGKTPDSGRHLTPAEHAEYKRLRGAE